MTKRMLMACVVGLMVGWSAVCTAVTLQDAVTGVGDGKYVRVYQGGSITVDFSDDCMATTPAVTLAFTQNSRGIITKFYHDDWNYPLYSPYYLATYIESFDWYGPDPEPEPLDITYAPYWDEVPFNRVTITALGPEPLYIDAVQASQTLASVTTATPTLVEALTDDPVTMIQDLVIKVASYNLQQGIDNSLDAKLEAALQALEDANVNNDASAVNRLQAFISEVEAQRGKKITNDQANALIADAQGIITVLTAP